jgi:predicted DNA-binding protein
MQRTQILLEPEQYRFLTQLSQQEKRSLSSLVREMLQQQIEARQKQHLQAAAEALRSDYEDDPDLTAFTALDGEAFHAQG